MYDRAMDALYTPGSTFKVVTLSAALETGTISKAFLLFMINLLFYALFANSSVNLSHSIYFSSSSCSF